jgi:hypothetical protein
VADPNRGDRTSELKEEIIRLGPWHQEVQITPEASTAAFFEAPEGYYPSQGPKDPRTGWMRMVQEIYPGEAGMTGKSFLDCACNCGGLRLLR